MGRDWEVRGWLPWLPRFWTPEPGAAVLPQWFLLAVSPVLKGLRTSPVVLASLSFLVEVNILEFSLTLCVVFGGGKKRGAKDEDDEGRGQLGANRAVVNLITFGHVTACLFVGKESGSMGLSI